MRTAAARNSAFPCAKVGQRRPPLREPLSRLARDRREGLAGAGAGAGARARARAEARAGRRRPHRLLQRLECRRHRPRERAERVAALEHAPDRNLERLADRADRACHRGVPLFSELARPQRIVAVGVVTGRDQHQLRLERLRQRDGDMVNERAEKPIVRTRGHREVDGEAAALRRPNVARRSGPRIQRRLVDRDEQHAIGVMEDVVGPVPVVHVPVDDHHPLEAAGIERMPRRERDVVEQAEPHRARRQRVVTGRTVGAERAWRRAVE